MKLVLKITPKFCGLASVDTVELIQLIRRELGLSLPDAKSIVDRCVFEDEIVDVTLPASVDAAALVRSIQSLETPATIDASIAD